MRYVVGVILSFVVMFFFILTLCYIFGCFAEIGEDERWKI